MKKAHRNSIYGKSFFLCLLAVCLVFFNVSCGLDVISVVLDDPVSVTSSPNKDSTLEGCIFEFSTRKLDNSNDMGKGYVYYNIYNKSSIENSEVNSLTTIANDSVRKFESAHSLINTYGYKELHFSNDTGASSDVFTLDNQNQNEIRIRLSNYGDEAGSKFSAYIKIGDAIKGVPVRLNGSSFDFGRAGSNDKVPETTDDDARKFEESQSDEEKGLYYVALFYVFMMYDDFYTPVYSPIHYLGTVTINATDVNN